MSGLEVIGSIASVVQLAGAVYSISIQLYEVANALSNAPADIKDLAHDLEIFSEELLLHSKLVNANNSHYSDQINRLTAKIIGRCATICEKIDKILKKLRSGSVLARLKWMYKEKEIRKLLGRLRDLKLSLMGTLSLLRTLKADHMMDALGVQAPSLLDGPQDENLSRETMEEVENTRRKLESITMDKCRPPSLSGTTLTPQSSWNSREMDENSGEPEQQREGDFRTVRSMSVQYGAVSRAIEQASTIPLVSAVALPGINTIMRNLGALESVQSFHSAVSHQENPFENAQDASWGLQSAESRAIPSNYLTGAGPSATSSAMGAPHSIHGVIVPVPVLNSPNTSSNPYGTNRGGYEGDFALNSDCYRSWQKDVAEASARHFNLAPKDAESLACSIRITSMKNVPVATVDSVQPNRNKIRHQVEPYPIAYQQPPQGQHGHGGYPNVGQHPGAGAPITSPSQQPLHQQHPLHNQASPILSSQPQQVGQSQGHAIHQQMNYPPPYGVPQPGMHYGMQGISPQAAAMAATAAASGQGYPYTLPDSGLPQTSPRMGGGVSVKQEAGRRSPKQMNNQSEAYKLRVPPRRVPSSASEGVMMLIKGEKYACEACVRSYRVSNCQHFDRPLQHINKKGRPVSQSQHRPSDEELTGSPMDHIQMQPQRLAKKIERKQNKKKGRKELEAKLMLLPEGVPTLGLTEPRPVEPQPSYSRPERTFDTCRPVSRSRSFSSRSRSPPRRRGGRRDSPGRNGGRRRRSPSYSSYSSYDDRSRSRSRSRGRDQEPTDTNSLTGAQPVRSNAHMPRNQVALPITQPSMLPPIPIDSHFDALSGRPYGNAFTDWHCGNGTSENKRNDSGGTLEEPSGGGGTGAPERMKAQFPRFQAMREPNNALAGSVSSSTMFHRSSSPPSHNASSMPPIVATTSISPSSLSGQPGFSEDAQRLQRQNSLIDFNGSGLSTESTRSFGDAIDASRGMIAMSQNTTPRNIYGGNGRTGRGLDDSYGFPTTYSASSSISSSRNHQSFLFEFGMSDLPDPDYIDAYSSNSQLDQGQLWWRAFTELRKEIPETRLHEAWANAHLKINAHEDVIAHTAINDLIIPLEESNLDLEVSIQQILDIAKVVQSTLDLKTGGFIWTCLSSVIRDCIIYEPSNHTARLKVFAQLAEITTLVARYNVMESMYHQWPGMTIDKDYETSLINLCVEVLRYLDAVHTHKLYTVESFFADTLQKIMQNINKADTACRGFSVTIVQDALQRTLDELENDDSDSDDAIEIQCGVKRRIEDISDKEDDSDGTAVGTQEVMAVKELPRAKRVKI